MLSVKEAKFGLADTGIITDNLLISAITKPPVPQITQNMAIPYTPKISVTNEIKIKRACGKIELDFINTDVNSSHIIYYQIYVDHQLLIDRSAGFEIPADSQFTKTELIFQNDPPDENLQIDFYFWADEANQIQLNGHRVRCGFGSELAAAAAIKIEKEGYQAIYAEFASTGASYTYYLKAFNSGITLDTGNDPLSIEGLLPYSEFYFTPLENEIVYLTGISLI
uniref:Uncharacterized protein n=1 Tax=candidate division WOR-3 bacterium TaxID=2052148 RepID=A0A7C6EBJ1_UNCW3